MIGREGFPASVTHARFLVRFYAQKHVEESPANESPGAWIVRAKGTERKINAALNMRINRADLNQLITDYEELESFEVGTHQDLRVNAAGTVDNRVDVLEQVLAKITATVHELLASAEPFARQTDKAAS